MFTIKYYPDMRSTHPLVVQARQAFEDRPNRVRYTHGRVHFYRDEMGIHVADGDANPDPALKGVPLEWVVIEHDLYGHTWVKPEAGHYTDLLAEADITYLSERDLHWQIVVKGLDYNSASSLYKAIFSGYVKADKVSKEALASV